LGESFTSSFSTFFSSGFAFGDGAETGIFAALGDLTGVLPDLEGVRDAAGLADLAAGFCGAAAGFFVGEALLAGALAVAGLAGDAYV